MEKPIMSIVRQLFVVNPGKYSLCRSITCIPVAVKLERQFASIYTPGCLIPLLPFLPGANTELS